MSERSRIQALEDRIEALERALAELRSAPQATASPAEEDIPWGVLAAVIAAMFPEAQLKELSVVAVHPRPAGRPWGLSGKLEHFQSHRIR